MRRGFVITGAALGLTLVAGCGPGSSAAAPSASSTTAPTTSSAAAVAVPAAPTAGAAGSCPYLDSQFVADANGQHVGSTKVSAAGGANGAHPSCFFYRPDGGLQITVRVYTGDPKVAQALVNQAAPVATSNPATDPAGWQGGSQSTGKTAVYAISRGGTAIVVNTNQAQTIKARRIADQAVIGLGL
jgi:UPF0176 protein